MTGPSAPSLTRVLVGSVLAGAASGGRTFTGLALQARAARPDTGSRLDATLAAPWAAGLTGVLALGELAADKLPIAPSRLEPPGLVGRLIAGATCGAAIALRGPAAADGPDLAATADPGALPDDPDGARARALTCALAGAAAALLGAWAGVRWRSAAASWFGRTWVGAVLEDVAVVGLAAAATR